jgi:Mce-associated membrane protein
MNRTVNELTQAQGRAEAARTRAIHLRRLAEAASGDLTSAEAELAPRGRRWRLRRASRGAMAAVVAVGSVCASLTASGYLVWHHHAVVQQRQRTAELATAARTAVLAMLSIDAGTARADVQRFIDDTTGQFKAGILLSAEDFVHAVEQSKESTKCFVQAVAVQSMTKDSAVVLVAGKSEVTKPGQAQPQSRPMRAIVDIQRDGGQLKLAKFEFIP